MHRNNQAEVAKMLFFLCKKHSQQTLRTSQLENLTELNQLAANRIRIKNAIQIDADWQKAHSAGTLGRRTESSDCQ